MTDHFQRFASNSSDALAMIAADGGIVFANQRFVELCMPRTDYGNNRNVDQLQLSPAFRKDIAAASASTLRNGMENCFVCAERIGRKQKQFRCRTVPCGETHDEAKVILELKEAFEPVNQDRFPEERDSAHLPRVRHGQNTKRNFFGVLDEFPAFVYLQRRDYKVAYANKKVRDLYGETELRLCYEVFAGRTTPCPICPTFEVFETGQSMEWEFSDEKGRTFCIYDYPFEDEGGEPLVMELGIDVTDLKRVEKELFQAQKLRAIGVLAGGLAHDLNNNLVPIIFNIDHALDRITDEETSEPLSEALQAAYRAANLVEQVLEYSRQQDISRAPLHLCPLIRDSLETFQVALGHEMTFEIDIDDRPDCVCANAAQMQQVLLNLLKNAEQAMPDGGLVSISLGAEIIEPRDVSRYPGISPGEFITLTIRDSGTGILAEDMERIFEPFFTTKKHRGGTGMGLAVVHSIVSNGGGTINVDSRPGAGTTFTIYLPKTRPQAPRLTGALCVSSGGGNRILLVDDDPGALSAMARTLRRAGFDVETATNGQEGFSTFSKAPGRYGLVLADQSMPGMNGISMSIKMLGVDPHARIVICTGHVEPSLEKQAIQEGIAGFATKPMTPSALVAKVRTYCPA
jgi:two-component system cell cycle sensor histidine kinase/response regulator CckA